MDIKITAKTPIMVGDDNPTEGGPREFFRLPDGTPAIPGSTLRGAIRNLLEIATFGKFSQVDDTRLAVRDLNQSAKPFYLRHFIQQNNKSISSRVKAGWLRFRNGHWELRRCGYVRIEQKDINAWLVTSVDFQSTQSARDKYEQLLYAGHGVQVHYQADQCHHQKSFGILQYDKVTGLNSTGREGYLVFSGQPANSTKHMEFVFSAPSDISPITVEDSIIREFLAIYKKSQEWQFLKSVNSPHRERGVPVFWLGAATPTSLGLSQMYKIPYRFTIRGMVHHSSPDHVSSNCDFVEILFGTAGADRAGSKGRVSFGDAKLDGQIINADEFYGVLNSPKPTYYPAYVEQTADPTHPDRVLLEIKPNGEEAFYKYASYTDLPWEDRPKVRGWKRYPARNQLITPPTPAPRADGKAELATRFTPLAQESSFTGRIWLHNIRSEEIGALVWALEWGGNPNLRHLVGMAKAFGYGQIVIGITGWELRPNSWGQPIINDVFDRRAFQQCFLGYMERWWGTLGENGTWANSLQIRTLLAMANPAKAQHAPSDRNLGHMVLDPQQKINQFHDAKKDGYYLQPFLP